MDNNPRHRDSYSNDWEKYYSRSRDCWCWESRSRRVTYRTASRSQKAVFEAGWVLLPHREKDQYLNVFTGKIVDHRTSIPEFHDERKPNDKNKRSRDQLEKDQNMNFSIENVGVDRPLIPKVDVNNNKRTRDQLQAANHYDNQARKSRRQDRNKGSVAKMRAFNNWVKNVLIDGPLQALSNHRNPPRIVHVLELACGKGGDYFKIQNACPRASHLDYVGVDIAKVGLEEFVRRLEQNRRRNSDGAQTTSQRLAAVNLGTDHLARDKAPLWTSRNKSWEEGFVLDRNDRFDLVSMQFALHYMFESEKRLKDFFTSWTHYLKEGSYFSVTTMDAQVVRQYLKENPGSTEIIFRDEQGRPTCTMSFDQRTRDELLQPDWSKNSLGMRYQFTLTECSESGESHNLVEAPEWIVSMDILCDYAQKYGNLWLVREESMNFHDFYRKHCAVPRHRELLRRMKVLPQEGQQFSELEWKLAGLYRTAVFQKGRGKSHGRTR